jgi:hypothetical protein
VHKSGDNLWISIGDFCVCIELYIEKFSSLRLTISSLEGFLEPIVQFVFILESIFNVSDNVFLENPVYKPGDNLWISFPESRVLISRSIPAQDDLRGGSRQELRHEPPLEIVSASEARTALSVT